MLVVFFDALVVKVRRDGAVRPTGVLVIYGINEEGIREPLDLLVANSESEASWREIFKRLKQRGLKGLEFLVSDDYVPFLFVVIFRSCCAANVFNVQCRNIHFI